MKERAGLLLSSTFHVAILAYAFIGLGSAKPFEVGPTEALPIEILTPQEFDAMTKGSKASKKVDAPKQKAEKIAAVEDDPADDDLPIKTEDVKAPPPPKAEAPPPPKAEQKPDQEAAKADAEKAEKAEAVKAEATKAAAAKAEVAKAEKAEAAKAAEQKAEKLAQAAEGERLAKVEAEKVAKDKAAKAAEQKAEAEKQAKAEADKAAKEKAEAEKQAKLEADKAAKEKAEKIAKLDAEKAAKEKSEKLAKSEADKKAAERKFDPNKIAALLPDKPSKSSTDSALLDKREAGRKERGGRELAPETTAGTSRGTASKLSASQRNGVDDAVREQVMQCWNPPIGAAGDGSLAVRVKFMLNADGTLSGSPSVLNSSSSPAFRAAAGAAMRAVQRCTPLKLPAEAFEYWGQGISINFDPKDMMGG